MQDSHVNTLHKLHSYLSKTGHDLVHEVEDVPSLKAFWDTMIEEIPDLLTDLEEILAEAKNVALEAGEVALETSEVIAEEAGDILLEAGEIL